MTPFDSKVLLISGGTGSFGHAVLRRFLDTGVREIYIFSRDEKKQDDMRARYRNDYILFVLGYVRNPGSVSAATTGVDYIFYAAALKQVPSCEFYPLEAVRTNVLGTSNLLEAALRNGVSRIICLSTDKAIYPINAMGMSKALMGKVMVATSRLADASQSVICGTRYGNVMASRGSVIPLFINQIRQGLPITINDPAMTRFMMSLEDAVELVLYAFTEGNNGEFFVQKAPASTVGDVAEALRQLFGKPDHPIKVIGTRHSEKLCETLLTREVMVDAEELGGYYRIVPDKLDLNYAKYIVWGEREISESLDYNSHNTTRLDVQGTKDLLMKLPFVRAQIEGRIVEPEA